MIRKICRSELRRAFTLVELLVVLAVISLLVAILLPAVQRARETARCAQCANNLKQIGLAILAHESAQGHLPVGGWGWRWSGDPDRGFDHRQPGGWIYNILPYIEQQSVHDMGQGSGFDAKRTVFALRAQIPLEGMNCPTRRSGLFDCDVRPGKEPYNQLPVDRVARGDYAGNMGDIVPNVGFPPGPKTLAAGDDPFFRSFTLWKSPSYAPFYVTPTGVFFLTRSCRLRDIVDGCSDTYLVGEKYLNPDAYYSGVPSGDDQNLYIGADRDTLRFANATYLPRRDARGTDNNHVFGSAHLNGVNMLLCDGSQRLISFQIEQSVHRALANRMDVRSLTGPE